MQSGVRKATRIDPMQNKLIDSFEKTVQEIRARENEKNFLNSSRDILVNPSKELIRIAPERDRMSE
jgi:hypothetical protein